MPYHGDCPLEAWEYWFDETPSEFVRSSLERFGEKNDANTIVEAIGITGGKISITTETKRIQYVGGILDRKLLRAISPDRAEEEHQIDMLQRYWRRHGHPFQRYWRDNGRLCRGDSWHFDKRQRGTAASWLQFCTLEEIEAVVKVARSWDDLCGEMDRIEARRHDKERKVFRANFRDVKMVVSEFVTAEGTGFVVSFENVNGEEFGETDTTPRILEEAKTLACRRAVEYVNGEYISAEGIMKAVKDSWTETTVPHSRLSMARATGEE